MGKPARVTAIYITPLKGPGSESVLSDSLPFYTAGAKQTSAPTPMVRARQPSLS